MGRISLPTTGPGGGGVSRRNPGLVLLILCTLLLQTSRATQPLYVEVRKVERKSESPPPPIPEQKFDFSGGG